MKIIVTGGAGFIGSNFIINQIKNTDNIIINLDKLTYAGNLNSLTEIEHTGRYTFYQADICDKNVITNIILENKPDAIVNFAAESHVDRSIDGPMEFIQTNIVGSAILLESALYYYKSLTNDKKLKFGASRSNSFKTEKYNKINGKYLNNLFFIFNFF